MHNDGLEKITGNCFDTLSFSKEKYDENINLCYPKTKDALLIMKYFGHYGFLYSRIFWWLMKGREKELLEFAQQLEKEEKENKSK